ncbi:efflux RND transporter periplasmic adaptor subunit [Shumkonia mesophila]|uniref:efflux RND transporter periplasmic adaptor subunit n=1 Tax=Shumkonia mesophila TaxID=2838854 RepID=UPI0029349702|nr:efflux RND transporter periplasmic adaptor subunit [Shumkonia mesophila]
MKRSFVLVAVLLLAAAGGYVYTHGMPALPWAASGGAARTAQPAGRPALPVTVAPVVSQAVPVTLGTIGTVQARASVAIRSRVDGQLLKAFFTEGQTVKRGEMLFALDPAPLEAQLRQAEAFLARDRAQLDNARIEMERYLTLATKGIATQQKLDETRAAVHALEATIRADLAAVEAARLQLSFTSIASPLEGRTGKLLVDPGNLVKANDVPLVVINQIRPITVAFSLPERHLPEIGRRMREGPLTVEARLPNLDLAPAKGTLSFINNAVNVATGTIELKATFKNADERLVPGQFVDVVLTVSVLSDALVVPAQAVQNGQNGNYAFVVKPDQTVEMRPLAVRTLDDGRMIAESGLKAGETVVTEGQMRLTPGARVSVKTAAPGTG